MFRIIGIVLGILASVSSVTEFDRFPGDDIGLTCTMQPENWYFTRDGEARGDLPSGAVDSSNTLSIINIASTHEGLYTCVDSGDNAIATFDLTVLALAKFVDCPQSVSFCDLQTLFTYEEGQSIVLNITLDFYGGGNRNEKQAVNFIFLKHPTNDVVVSCPDGESCVSLDNRFNFSVLEPNDIRIQFNNGSVNDSGIYRAEVEVNDGGNLVNSITSVFTITITSTVPPLPTTTSSTIVMVTVTTSPSSTVPSETIPTVSDTLVVPSPTSTTTITNTLTLTTTSEPVSMPTITTNAPSTSTVYTNDSVTTSSMVSVIIGAVEDEGFEDAHIVSIVVAAIFLVAIIVTILVIGLCIVARKKHGSSSWTITYMIQWISVFRKDKYPPSSGQPKDRQSDDCDGHYSKIGEVHYSVNGKTEIIRTEGELYAKVTISRSEGTSLPDSTLNSDAFLV